MRISEETYKHLKELVDLYESGESSSTNSAYIEEVNIQIELKYNPNFGDDRVCTCGHPYHRHFDSYENMEVVGCKYCQCYHFEDKLIEDRDQKLSELI